jgi:hypothetical protein
MFLTFSMSCGIRAPHECSVFSLERETLSFAQSARDSLSLTIALRSDIQ